MVCFVLNADTHQFIAFHLKGFAVEVLCLDEDAGGALYFLIDAGQRQTAFLTVNDFIGKRLNYRVNENSQVVFSLISTTIIRMSLPIWGAASPTPGAAYIVSAMSAANCFNSSLNSVTSCAFSANRGSGYCTIGSKATELSPEKIRVG